MLYPHRSAASHFPWTVHTPETLSITGTVPLRVGAVERHVVYPGLLDRLRAPALRRL